MKVIGSFGEKLRELRENAGLLQKHLAAQMGISKSTVSQYENQNRTPSLAVVLKIASIFHVSADYLFGVDKVKMMDLSGLSEKEIEIIESLVKVLRENKKR